MPRGWVLLALAAVAWTGIIGAAGAVVTLRQMIGDARYWPPACAGSPCVLTGLGGIVTVWERHVDRNLDRGFVVRGVCASACEIAYQRARTKGAPVTLDRDARLIVHAPSRAIPS